MIMKTIKASVLRKLWPLLLALLLALFLAFQATSQGEEDAVQEDLETFVPSEELPADSAISFPVDI